MRASNADCWLSNQKEEKRRSHPDSWVRVYGFTVFVSQRVPYVSYTFCIRSALKPCAFIRQPLDGLVRDKTREVWIQSVRQR